jgi:hypothetical protein
MKNLQKEIMREVENFKEFLATEEKPITEKPKRQNIARSLTIVKKKEGEERPKTGMKQARNSQVFDSQLLSPTIERPTTKESYSRTFKYLSIFASFKVLV